MCVRRIPRTFFVWKTASPLNEFTFLFQFFFFFFSLHLYDRVYVWHAYDVSLYPVNDSFCDEWVKMWWTFCKDVYENILARVQRPTKGIYAYIVKFIFLRGLMFYVYMGSSNVNIFIKCRFQSEDFLRVQHTWSV